MSINLSYCIRSNELYSSKLYLELYSRFIFKIYIQNLYLEHFDLVLHFDMPIYF